MIVHRGHKFKLRPTRSQEALFAQMSGNARFVYNQLLAWTQEIYRTTGESVINRKSLCARITVLKKAYPFLQHSHVHTLQTKADDLIRAYRSFFQRTSGHPRFKAKRQAKHSFRYKSGVKVEGQRVYLPKIGWVRMRRSRAVIGVVKTVTVSRRPSGWYVSLSCEEEVIPLPVVTAVVGVDLGLNVYAMLSTGEQIANPRHYRRAERKLRRLQRALSRKRRGSANRRKARQQAARQHESVVRMRRDFQHKLTTRLICENQGIGVESLNVRGLARTWMAKSILDAGFGELRRQLAYKAAWYGRTLVAAPRYYPSTKTCSSCGHVVAAMPLRQRQFACPACSLTIDRDLNAARNLAAVAIGQMETQNACGDERQTQVCCAAV